KRWLQISNSEMNCRLYCIFKDIFRADSPETMHFITKIEALSPKRWHLLEDIVRWMRKYDILFMFNNWLGLFTTFGFIESGFNCKGQAFIRWIISIEDTMGVKASYGKFYV